MLFQVNQKIANVKISLYFYKMYTITCYFSGTFNQSMDGVRNHMHQNKYVKSQVFYN